jgi:hypothetical protein
VRCKVETGNEREKAATVKESQETARVVGEAEERGGQCMAKEAATKSDQTHQVQTGNERDEA